MRYRISTDTFPNTTMSPHRVLTTLPTLFAVLLAAGCGKPAPSLQGAWSMGPGGMSLRFEGGRYVQKQGGASASDVSGTWSMAGELRSTPVAWRLKWIDPDAFEATARNGAAATFRKTPQ